MSEKTFLYEYDKSDLENLKDIEKDAFKKANALNDKILDLKIMIDDMNDELDEYLQYLEDEKISKICEFRGGECIEFDEEILNAIVTTLKKSIGDTNKSIGYNPKKIKINRVING